jgi:hypothetical protein
MIQNRLMGPPPGSSNTENAHERCVPQWLARRRPPSGAAGEMADRQIAGALGNIEYRQQTSLRIEDRRARATQPSVPAAKMVGTMHENRPSIRDAGADTVCAFDPLRPDATQPYTPFLELVILALVATMVDGDSLAIAQENDVRLQANNGIEAVYLFLGQE